MWKDAIRKEEGFYYPRNEISSSLYEDYNSITRILKNNLIAAKQYIEQYKDDSTEKEITNQYKAATNLVSLTEKILPSLHKMSKEIQLITKNLDRLHP